MILYDSLIEKLSSLLTCTHDHAEIVQEQVSNYREYAMKTDFHQKAVDFGFANVEELIVKAAKRNFKSEYDKHVKGALVLYINIGEVPYWVTTYVDLMTKKQQLVKRK